MMIIFIFCMNKSKRGEREYDVCPVCMCMWIWMHTRQFSPLPLFVWPSWPIGVVGITRVDGIRVHGNTVCAVIGLTQQREECRDSESADDDQDIHEVAQVDRIVSRGFLLSSVNLKRERGRDFFNKLLPYTINTSNTIQSCYNNVYYWIQSS